MKYYFIIVSFAICLFSCHQGEAPDKRDAYYTRHGNKIVITPIKHASIQISYQGKEIEIDPVSSYSRPIVDYTDKPKADYILITNEHRDHFDPYAIGILCKQSTNILLPLRCIVKFRKTQIYSHCVEFNNNMKAKLADDITVYSVPAYNHTDKYKRSLAPKGRGNGYLLDIDGFRIYIAGDTEPITEMKRLGKIDVAFFPCDYIQAMTLKQYREAVKIIRPKTLYPYHYGATDTDSIIMMTKGLDIDVRLRSLK